MTLGRRYGILDAEIDDTKGEKVVASRLLGKEVPKKIVIVDKKLSRLLERSVQELELSRRARNVVAYQSIETVGALASSTRKEMMRDWKNCGKITVDEIAGLLGELGLSLGTAFVYPLPTSKNSSGEPFPVDEWI